MTFVANGYEVRTLSKSAHYAVRCARNELAEFLNGSLETYRGGDEKVHARAAEIATPWAKRVLRAEMTYFRTFIGGDLHVQRKPFLRISRPGVEDDNIGLHRDTWYGDTPYEISVWIPFTDTDEFNALRVAPGSHLWSEEAHPVERIAGKVEKGSLKHSLGFIHGQPKRMASAVDAFPLPVRVGTMIVFSLALLHGVEVNRSTRTRISMDIRLTNSLAPVKFSRSRDDNYYEPLATTQVTEAARKYYEAQCSSTSST